MIELISQPWPWYVAGPMIALVLFSLHLFGKRFGMSSSLKTMCAAGGAGKVSDYFDYDWKASAWNLVVIAGSVAGGFIASQYFTTAEPIQLAEATLADLQALGVEAPQANTIVPESLFNWESLLTLKGFILMVVGGFLVGFGTRYAEGCTSGHAISGLSNLQLPSLIAVIGFFIGGLVMTFLILPLILAL